jgi:regulator of protease activity HflC (stomatin/prohibitin superfamily)
VRTRRAHAPQPSRGPAKGRFQGATPLSNRRVRVTVAVALAVAGLGLLLFVSGARIEREDIGHVGVIRNGGPLSNRAIHKVLMPGTGPTWAGWFTQSPHEYPARRVVLLYTVTSDARRGARPGVDVVRVPTRDGVQVGIEGTLFYHFVGEQNLGLLRQFDKTFGSRSYSAGGPALQPYDGDAGFEAMFETVVRPILDSDLRREVGAFQCAQIVTACKLVRRVGGPQSMRGSNANAALIQDRINRSLENDIAGALGGRFFVDVHFRLVRVTLPQKVQTAVDAAQAGSANVQVARQRLRQGRYEARRNELLARAYSQSPGLANIDALKAAPRKSTVIINTSKGTPPVLLGGGK